LTAGFDATFGSMRPHSDAACSFESSSLTGTLANIGSAFFAWRSE